MATMKKFFLIQVEKGRNHQSILIFARDEDGKKYRFIVTDFYPYFYVDADVIVPDRPEIVNVIVMKLSEKQSMFKTSLKKIFVTKTPVVPKIRDYFHDRGLFTYEADILYPLRFRIDRQIYRGFTLPVEVFKRKPMTHSGRPWKSKGHWWDKQFTLVNTTEVAGF